MQIPFPERIPLLYAILFAFLLFIGLLASGTGMLFSCLAFAFVVLGTIAFNMAGGFTRPSGSYVFFFAVLGVVLGLAIKVVIWEPAESLLHAPITTMSAYTAGMAAMLAAVYVSRKISRKEGFLQEICTTDEMGLAAIGCVIGGFVIPLLAQYVVDSGDETLLPLATASKQFDRFLAMGIILGTTYEIRKSGGKRCYNISVVVAAALIWFNGLILNFSKEALFTPPLCWLVAGAAMRFRYSIFQWAGIFLFFWLANHYMVPYSQYGRNFKDPTNTYSQQLAIANTLLGDLGDVREKYLADERAIVRKEDGFYFFNNPMGLFDRLQMIGVDDSLNAVTNEKGEYGMAPYLYYASAVIPRVLWKNKPTIGYGNTFAHEIGFNPEDTTTGISFTPIGEVYHEAKWLGVLIVAPLIWFMLFSIMDSLCGDLRKSPWGILAFATFAHIGPEGGIEGACYAMTYGALIVVIVAYFSAYVMPLVASFVTPPQRKLVVGTAREGKGPAFANPEPEPAKQ